MRKEKSQAILAGSFKSKTNFLFLIAYVISCVLIIIPLFRSLILL